MHTFVIAADRRYEAPSGAMVMVREMSRLAWSNVLGGKNVGSTGVGSFQKRRFGASNLGDVYKKLLNY